MDVGSKIPTFGAASSKFTKPVAPAALQPKLATSHTRTTSDLKPVRQTVYRSHSRDAIVTKRKSSLLRKNDFSSRSNLHKPSSAAAIAPVPDDDEHMIIDDEPIELVGGSVETLSDAVDATYEVNGTFNVPPTPAPKNTTYSKGVAETPNSTERPFNGTFDVPQSAQKVVNETFDDVATSKKKHSTRSGSRLSTDLAEQMIQLGLSPGPGLNSTVNHEMILNLTDLPSTNQYIFSETETVNPINVTNLLCLPPTNTDQNNDSAENPLDKTLVAQQSSIPLESPSNETQVICDPVNQSVVLMRETNKGVIPPKQRFSLGLDLSEYVQDCSIELCDMSNSSSMPGQNKSSSQNTGGKQSSFEMDESLGILTPEQMKEFLDSTKTNTGKSC